MIIIITLFTISSLIIRPFVYAHSRSTTNSPEPLRVKETGARSFSVRVYTASRVMSSLLARHTTTFTPPTPSISCWGQQREHHRHGMVWFDSHHRLNETVVFPDLCMICFLQQGLIIKCLWFNFTLVLVLSFSSIQHEVLVLYFSFLKTQNP